MFREKWGKGDIRRQGHYKILIDLFRKPVSENLTRIFSFGMLFKDVFSKSIGVLVFFIICLFLTLIIKEHYGKSVAEIYFRHLISNTKAYGGAI